MLEKASITELSMDGSKTVGASVSVQFNPATMKVQLSNSTEGGKSRGRQTRQFLGTSSTVLTVELIFDTADESVVPDKKNPKKIANSVRDRTNFIERYVLPVSTGTTKEAPPKMRFQWGTLIFDGLLDNVSIDMDHFAEDGTPLRAKLGLSIKEQNSSYEFHANKTQPLASATGNPPGGWPGSSAGPSTQSATSIGGETAADFAARNGLDPTAWRGLDIGSDSSLSLSAGLDVGFSADLSVSAGLGVTAGFEAGVSATLSASVGLDVSASVGLSGGASFTASATAGFAVASAGGVSAAIAQVQNAGATQAVQQTAQAFQQSLPAVAGPASPAVQSSNAAAVASPAPPQLGPPTQSRTPLSQTGLPSVSQQAAAPSAPTLPQIDARAASFGFGIPLRTQFGSGSTHRANLAVGGVALGAQAGSGDPPMTTNPTIPPWVALPASEFTVDTAGAIQLKRRPQPSCGCSSQCGCGRRT